LEHEPHCRSPPRAHRSDALALPKPANFPARWLARSFEGDGYVGHSSIVRQSGARSLGSSPLARSNENAKVEYL
jgi:hypothetical protein